MGRPRRNVEDEAEVGPMEEREFKAFLKKLDLAQVEVEEAAEETKTKRSELSAIWKEFKKKGGKPDTMREVMRMRKMDEGDLIQHEADRQAYAKWMKLPIGAQPDMFEEDPPRTSSGAPPPPVEVVKPHGRKAAVENTTGSPLN